MLEVIWLPMMPRVCVTSCCGFAFGVFQFRLVWYLASVGTRAWFVRWFRDASLHLQEVAEVAIAKKSCGALIGLASPWLTRNA